MGKTESIVAKLREVDASWSEHGELCAIAAYEIERLVNENDDLKTQIKLLQKAFT